MFLSRREQAKYPENIDDNMICMFCMDVCCQPIECLGPCKTRSCRRCASQWSLNGQRIVGCPKKCITPWQYKLLPSVPTPMCCPYSPKCQINFVEDFQAHLQNCQFLPSHLQLTNNLRKKFLCSKQHPLKFFVGSFDELTKSVCEECGERGTCRSICLKCKKMYCVKCREPPCSKECCPNGHKYKFNKPCTTSTVCDICSMCPALVKYGVYTDVACNFDICEKCYQHLPNSKESFENLTRDDDLKCKKDHILKKTREPAMKICSVCDIERPCWKVCDTCEQFFCMSCKQPTITQLNECDQDHKFKGTQDQRQCMACDAPPSRCAYDPQCGICLCVKCYKRYTNIDAEKRRLLHIPLCEKNHPLRYYAALQKSKCSGCGQDRIFQFYCSDCTPNKVYCLRCKKADISQKCYFGDPLTKCKKVPKLCLVCQEEKEEVWECRRCKLVVCQTCKENSAKGEEKKQGMEIEVVEEEKTA